MRPAALCLQASCSGRALRLAPSPLVRQLRRILPEGAIVLVGFWADDGGGSALKALEATAEADAHATSSKEAAPFCIDAAHSHEPPRSETSKDDRAPQDDKGPKAAKSEKAPARVA
jgi:hypothetical protein